MLSVREKIMSVLPSPQTIKNIRSNIDRFLSDKNRFYILFVAVFLSYAYLVINALVGEDTPEKESTAYLLFPGKGGYREIRGDIQSPSLFQWNISEGVLMSCMGLISVWLFYYLWKQKSTNSTWLVLVQFVLVWMHSVIFLLFLPVNNFHKRILYNGRALVVSVVNDPLKELIAAFLFIVVLPLPGGAETKYTERVSWLALKIGIFYVAQSILLGSPNYTIEPSEEGKIIPQSDQQLKGYAIFLVLFLVVYFFY